MCRVTSTDPDLTAGFAVNGKAPACVIVVTVERVYYQCTKAIIRSKLWDVSRHLDRSGSDRGLRGERQGAGLRHRGDGRAGLLPVHQGDHPLEAVGCVASRRPIRI